MELGYITWRYNLQHKNIIFHHWVYTVHHETDRSSNCCILCFISEYLYMKGEWKIHFKAQLWKRNIYVYFSITSRTAHNMEHFCSELKVHCPNLRYPVLQMAKAWIKPRSSTLAAQHLTTRPPVDTITLKCWFYYGNFLTKPYCVKILCCKQRSPSG